MKNGKRIYDSVLAPDMNITTDSTLHQARTTIGRSNMALNYFVRRCTFFAGRPVLVVGYLRGIYETRNCEFYLCSVQ